MHLSKRSRTIWDSAAEAEESICFVVNSRRSLKGVWEREVLELEKDSHTYERTWECILDRLLQIAIIIKADAERSINSSVREHLLYKMNYLLTNLE